MSTVSYSWLPFDASRGWQEAGEIAVRATLQEARRHGGQPSIVSVQRDAFDGYSPHVNQAAKTWESGTRKGRWPTGGGPVLAWLPDVRVLQRAARTARGSALVAVQWSDPRDDWWCAWAAQVGVVDLSSGEVTPDTRSSQLKKDIEYVMWNGNNGWPPRDSITKGTVRYLRGVAERGDLDGPAFVGAAVVAGKNEDAINRLRQMIAQAGHTATR